MKYQLTLEEAKRLLGADVSRGDLNSYQFGMVTSLLMLCERLEAIVEALRNLRETVAKIGGRER